MTSLYHPDWAPWTSRDLFEEEASLLDLLLHVEADGALSQIDFVHAATGPLSECPADLEAELDAYFAAELTEFAYPLCPRGTPFQLSVWQALRQIPYGQTVSYLDVAVSLGNPAATRAVGAANGRNPLPVIVPCHRVIGANGKLTGFGGGLPTKAALLRLENAGLLKLRGLAGSAAG